MTITGENRGPEGDPGAGYNKGELITTRSLLGPRNGYPEESTKNVMIDTELPWPFSCKGKREIGPEGSRRAFPYGQGRVNKDMR
jgi:hypothetical protein